MRNYAIEAVILKKYRIGEIHKGLWIFSRELGISRIIAHGAFKMKNRFRIVTEPFIHARMYIYRNPVKDTEKLNDIELIDAFEGIRTEVVKYYIASLWAEFIIVTRAGGNDFESLFDLFIGALRNLDNIGKEKSVIVSMQFLIRMIKLLGFIWVFDECSVCGRKILNNEEMYFSLNDGTFRCEKCKKDYDMKFEPEERRYLMESLKLSLDDSLELQIAPPTVSLLKKLVYAKIQSISDKVLNSIRSAEGMI